MSGQDDYCYSFGRISAVRNMLIPKVRVEELARAKGVQEVLAHLEETEYTHYLSQAKRVGDFEAELEGALDRSYALCRGMVPQEWIVDVFSVRREFEGFKEALRAKGHIPEELEEITRGKSPPEADLALDREMFSRILGMAKEDGVKSVIREEIDLLNILAVARAGGLKERFDFFIEGGFLPQEGLEKQTQYPFLADAGSLAEKMARSREFLLLEARRIAAEGMDSPAVVFAFLLEKEAEVRALSAIIKSKLMGLEAVPA